MSRRRLQLAICLSICLFFSFCCGCGKKAEEAPPPPGAVTVMTLQEANPGDALHLTGSVESFKEEDLGFEVGGRVAEVIEPGKYVEGPIEGREAVINQGDRLALLDTVRYEVAVDQAAAQDRVVTPAGERRVYQGKNAVDSTITT